MPRKPGRPKSAEPTAVEQIHIRILPEVKASVRAEADKLELSISQYLLGLHEEHVKRKRAKRKS